MSIIKRLFGKKRPPLKKEDIPNFEKVAEFLMWFIKNEQFVNVICNRSSNIIFNEGYRPKCGTYNNPESIKSHIDSLVEWFILKVFIDLNMLKDESKENFKQFIDLLDEAGKETLISAHEIATKYNLIFDNFVYEREIKKIPRGPEREWFKVSFLADNVLGAEIRILMWLYHEYFGEWY